MSARRTSREPIEPPRQVARCCWPIGDPRDKTFRLCGDPVAIRGAVYCATHAATARRTAPGGRVR